MVILGGNFTLGSSEGLAMYDTNTGSVYPLAGASVNGTVHALFVSGNELYIGGIFTVLNNTGINGFAVYNLALQQWDNTDIQPLVSNTATVVVRSITASTSKSGTVFVAGSFDSAGSLPCRSICSFNTASKQWNGLGDGISGDISDVVYAGVCISGFAVI
jgi:hypothetical protein